MTRSINERSEEELKDLLERAIEIIYGMTHPDEMDCRLDNRGFCQEQSFLQRRDEEAFRSLSRFI